ncbi:MAG TPA: hypothetical protein VFJ06_11505 [Halococcus sp.]|nr:hypothetical protein [Halococcus sp.]
MSEATEHDSDDLRRRVLGDRETPLRDEMEAFVTEHGAPDIKEVRRAVTTGRPLSELVVHERDERL